MSESHSLKVETDNDIFLLKGRPCELSSFSFVPTERKEDRERTYFNTEKKEHYSNSTYDRLFHPANQEGYNNKLHRCDREHAKSRGLTVNDEEKVKTVPVLASTYYGQRIANVMDPPNREHVRVGHVKAEFYRRNGINVE